MKRKDWDEMRKTLKQMDVVTIVQTGGRIIKDKHVIYAGNNYIAVDSIPRRPGSFFEINYRKIKTIEVKDGTHKRESD